MKKLKATITKKDGTQKEVFVIVDEQTAEMLKQLGDKKMVNEYLVEEYKMFMADVQEQRHTQSLDKSLDNGFDLVDEKQDVAAAFISNEDREKVREAIKKLDQEQQWIVQEVFFRGRTQIDVARELQISKQAMSQRMTVIKEQLKIFLKNFAF